MTTPKDPNAPAKETPSPSKKDAKSSEDRSVTPARPEKPKLDPKQAKEMKQKESE